MGLLREISLRGPISPQVQSVYHTVAKVLVATKVPGQLLRFGLCTKSCTSTFVVAKTLPQYLSFHEDFANGYNLIKSTTVSPSCDEYPYKSRHQPTIGLVCQANEIQQDRMAQAIPCQESTNPSWGLLTVDFTRFHGTGTGLCA